MKVIRLSCNENVGWIPFNAAASADLIFQDHPNVEGYFIHKSRYTKCGVTLHPMELVDVLVDVANRGLKETEEPWSFTKWLEDSSKQHRESFSSKR